jgi:2,3-bisphosphoglycerate-independent phosphoglycerate mutase
MNKKVLLMILDGWGIATNKKVSAIDQASKWLSGRLTQWPNG